jgi:L-seryl-tRNA(Ser) seleniumtransferase
VGESEEQAAASAARLRELPAVHELADGPGLAEERERYGRPAVVAAARSVIGAARSRLVAGGEGSATAAEVRGFLLASARAHLRPVINATGVVLHTNLGRAPLGASVRAAILEAAGYTNLELRLTTGDRGGRDDAISAHVQALTGAQQAFAVNNGAAAALLALAATAAGREVIVSRGELVEIGGGFRVPEVLAQSGCRLVEVGTTNRTRPDDYRRALSPATGAILKVHRSNFAVLGFTEETDLSEVAEIAHHAGIPALYDEGTGDPHRLRDGVQAGVDVVTCSGDKLLGGPQAGLVLGASTWIEQIRRHPLARALRIDKLRLAALEATLALWRAERSREIPAIGMLEEPAESVRLRAESLHRLITDGVPSRVVATSSAAGGGTRPAEPIPSFGVRIDADRPEALAQLLRMGEPPVVGRVVDGAFTVDLRTVSPEELPALAAALRAAVKQLSAAPVLNGVAHAMDGADES